MRVTPISLQSGEPRTLKHYKNTHIRNEWQFSFWRPVFNLPASNSPPGPLQDKPVWGINQNSTPVQYTPAQKPPKVMHPKTVQSTFQNCGKLAILGAKLAKRWCHLGDILAHLLPSKAPEPDAPRAILEPSGSKTILGVQFS